MSTTPLEKESFETIKLIGYEGVLLEENEYKKALQEGPKSLEYTALISYLANELRILCNLDENVNPPSTPDESTNFVIEVGSFLNELGCPHPSLTQGHVSDRLSTVAERILLVEHLATELMAARMLREKRPEKKMELKLQESSQAADLRKILQILGFSKPPPNFTMQAVFQRLVPAVENIVKKAGPDLLGTPIFNGTLSEKQWKMLADINTELHEDFSVRREMLLRRLDCTIQSFQWSEKTRGKEELFEKAYTEKRKVLNAEPDVDLSDLLAAREDLAVIEKTSSASVRKNTKSAINKVIIGQVPDRGGRTSEQAPPPPEMPPWQQRNAGPSGGGHRGGTQFNRGTSNYSRGGGGSSRGGEGSRGRPSNWNSYDNSNARGGGRDRSSFDSAGSYGGDSYRDNYSRGGGGGETYGSHSGYSHGGGYDSSGSYGDYSQGHQESKRAKTYDDYRLNRQSYADQYVQDAQHNQQYHPRGNRSRGGRGRSNYNRGGGGRNYR